MKTIFNGSAYSLKLPRNQSFLIILKSKNGGDTTVPICHATLGAEGMVNLNGSPHPGTMPAVLADAGPALAASESAKMKGQDQNTTEPARHRAQSAKMHKQHQTQNPSSQSGSGTVNTEGTTQK